MKKLLYIAILGIGLTACHGTDDYDAYVQQLKEQPAVIDTISSPASYAAYIERLQNMTQSFEEIGVKLDETQADELQQLGLDIQKAMERTYTRLAQTPATLPDSIPVPD